MTGQVVESLVSDVGGVTLSLHPPLSFVPDGIRLSGGQIEFYGRAEPRVKRLMLEVDPEVARAIRESGGLLLVGHPAGGGNVTREFELAIDA